VGLERTIRAAARVKGVFDLQYTQQEGVSPQSSQKHDASAGPDSLIGSNLTEPYLSAVPKTQLVLLVLYHNAHLPARRAAGCVGGWRTSQAADSPAIRRPGGRAPDRCAEPLAPAQRAWRMRPEDEARPSTSSCRWRTRGDGDEMGEALPSRGRALIFAA